MFNYNVINPVNIHYRKYPEKNGDIKKADSENKGGLPSATDENSSQRRFPNGNKVAIDYTKNQVNIAQILQDFRSTVAAINTPDDIKEEVESYLAFTTRESQKDSPSKEIILSNLKNAARITDSYIQDSLKKPSRVVQDWVDALFLQRVNLKSDPNEINEDFRVKIPEKKSEQIINEPHKGGLKPLNEDTAEFTTTAATATPQTEEISTYTNYTVNYPVLQGYAEQNTSEAVIDAVAEVPQEEIAPEIKNPEFITVSSVTKDPYEAKTENEFLAKEVLKQGKEAFENGSGLYDSLKIYDEALSLVEGSDNINIKSAIYYERARVFDTYDYAELALIDYNKATKCEDGNLRAQAHIKMGNIYDDYVQIDPALDQYTRAIQSSEEVNNLQGKTRALRYMASMFAGIYDAENTETFTELAMESAKETNNPKTVARTYLEAANNYKYIGEDSKALQVYSSLAQEDSVQDDYDTLAQNYMEASMLMDKKGNKKKSYALLLKSKEYQRLARLKRSEAV